MQASPAFAEQGFGNLKPEARDETAGLPLSDSRYPKGATIAGDEQKIRSDARKHGMHWLDHLPLIITVQDLMLLNNNTRLVLCSVSQGTAVSLTWLL